MIGDGEQCGKEWLPLLMEIVQLFKSLENMSSSETPQALVNVGCLKVTLFDKFIESIGGHEGSDAVKNSAAPCDKVVHIHVRRGH